MTITGRSIGEIAAVARPATGAIRPASRPLREGGAFGVVRGTLAPDGAVIKTSAASQDLMRHRGPAVVFRGYDDMLARIDDPALPVTPDSVLVLAGCGPVGVPGMPEWGMIPIPARLVRAGVTDMVRVTDARMSGTSFGTVLLHVAPEAAVGGPLGLVRDGDLISVDVPGRHARPGGRRRRAGRAAGRAQPAAAPAPAGLARPVRAARHAGAGRLRP